MLVLMTAGSIHGKLGAEYVCPSSAMSQVKAHPYYTVGAVGACALLYIYRGMITGEAKKQYKKLQQKIQRKSGQGVAK